MIAVFMARPFSCLFCLEERNGHTSGVLVFAGMKGNPFGEFLFNHVAFFEGEVS
jgi:hypothetical protein